VKFVSIMGVAALLVVVAGPTISIANTKTVPMPRPRPGYAAPKPPEGATLAFRPAPLVGAAVTAIPSSDIPLVKQALERIRRGKSDEASGLQALIRDPVAKKVVEWAILRSDDTLAGFDHYTAFIASNPSWPSIGVLRRRAESTLWEERRDPATTRAFFASVKPSTPKGRLALARALLAQGDRAGGEAYLRATWRNDALSRELETHIEEAFHDHLTLVDHKARMDGRLAAEDVEAGLRIAQRLGGVAPAIARARAAVIAKAKNAGALLDAVPAEAQQDAGYMFSRAQWLRRNDRPVEAARLLLAVPHDPTGLHNLDEWWVERRLVARKLLDLGDPRTAYEIARDAAPPTRENYRGEHQFTAGWIALRFLNDPALALTHFTRIAEGISNPITLARSEYWQARAAEAAGRHQEARSHYEAAARFPTAYYGQIARGRLGLGEIELRQLPQPSPAERAALMNLELVRAIEILYAAGARELVIPAVADLAEHAMDITALSGLAELTAQHQDARAMLLIGKAVLGRGYAFDAYAFPTVGVPHYGAIGPEVDRSVIYSIVRQESMFDQRDVSTARAVGLMQVTPEAGRYVAKKFGVSYDFKRLTSDPIYNCQMGAAELGELLQDYRGSYILAFAGYNAGRGRVHEWVQRYGDPRDSNVDPIDWVERIPFSETRNYVQRVVESLQVYRVRFGLGSRLMIEADLHRGGI
jgi:soluble lytic murein transglycosylase